ncbi:MAG TPA: DUF1365 domain-containing protein [Acidimicrobiales bacterium]|nr:DUF1365 domain-containing protein [Acidimicrobiales bacterium]
MNSAVFEGTIRHRRSGPRSHQFTYRVAMPYLDLDELDQVCALHPLWSLERPNGASLRRADFLGDTAVPLATAVRDLVESRTGTRPGGPVRLLAHVRTWGWLFNPIAVYFCFDEPGGRVVSLVLDVTNTPWHEHHAYVVSGGEGEHWLPKELHVSPFFGMDQLYRLRVVGPGDALLVSLASLERGRTVFDASLALRRRELSRAALGRVLWRYPALTHRVSAGIYWQAVRLWAKGTPVHPHPPRPEPGAAAGAAAAAATAGAAAAAAAAT